MITGIGVDLVLVNRMDRWLKDTKLMERYFHSDEILFISSLKNGTQSLAARFAAKEAFGKALGTGLSNINLKDIVVTNNENGKPQLKLFGTALKAFEESGATKAHISLSHEKDNAIAMIVLEKED